MSHSKKHAKRAHRNIRRQQSAGPSEIQKWLSAGALAVGFGAALTGGSGVASAHPDSPGAAAGSHHGAPTHPAAVSATPSTPRGHGSAGNGSAHQASSNGANTTHSATAHSAGQHLHSAPVASARTQPASTVTAPQSGAPLAAAAVTTVAVPASTAAPVTTSATVTTAKFAPNIVQRLVSGVLSFFGLNSALPPHNPIWALVWAGFRDLEYLVGLVPIAGRPTVSSADTTTGTVTGTVGARQPDGFPLGYSVTTPPAQGTLTIDAKGNFSYTPSPTASAGGATTVTFTVRITDAFAAVLEKVTIPVGQVADTPTAPVSSAQTTNADGSVTGTLTSTDPAGQPLSYVYTSNPLYGSLRLNNQTGQYVYTPTAAAQASASVGGPTTDSFQVVATNGTYTSAAATITVTIGAVADVPSAPVSASQRTAIGGVVTGTLSATDPAGQALSYTISGQPADGTMTISGATYTYTPTLAAQEAASVGGPTTDSFTVTATNGYFTSAASTVNVTITPTADTPSGVTMTQNEAADGTITGTLTANDPLGKPLTYVVTQQGSNGTVTVTGNTYTYTATALGSFDTFDIAATNGTFTGQPLSIEVYVAAGQVSTPTISAQSTDADGIVTGTLSASGPAGTTLSYSASGQPANGTVTITGDAFTYTPTAAARLAAADGGPTSDSFTVVATATVADYASMTYTSATATITVPITPIADIPTAPTSSTPSTDVNGVVTGILSSSDPAGKLLSYSVTGQPANGTVTVAGDVYTYTPTANAQVSASAGGPIIDTFAVTATNGSYTSTAATITVPIAAVVDVPTPPVASAQNPDTNGTAGLVSGILTSTDSAGLPLTYTVASSALGGYVTFIGNHYLYTPVPEYYEQLFLEGRTTDSFTVVADNGYYTSAPTTIVVPLTALLGVIV